MESGIHATKDLLIASILVGEPGSGENLANMRWLDGVIRRLASLGIKPFAMSCRTTFAMSRRTTFLFS